MKSGRERAARTPVKNVIKEDRGGFFSKKELSAFQGLVSFVMLTTFPSLEEPKAAQGEKLSQLVPNRRKKVKYSLFIFCLIQLFIVQYSASIPDTNRFDFLLKPTPILCLFLKGHFRVHLNLHFKSRLGAKSLL